MQKYLAAERLYLAKQVFGESPDEISANIMLLFKSRTRIRDKTGGYKDGPPFRSLGAADILRHLPKFGGESTSVVDIGAVETTTSTEDDAGVEPELTDGAAADVAQPSCKIGALPAKNISKYRPSGVKKAKRAAGGPSHGGENALQAIAMAMKEKNIMKKSELRFKNINALPEGEEKTQHVLQFLSSENSS